MGRLIRLLLPLFLLLLLALPPEREQAAPEPVPEPVPVVQVIPHPPEPEPEEDKPEARAVGECTVTYYDPCVRCCGKADGITASGAKATPYETCAVDPAVIPLGSIVIVDFGDGELRRYRAEDTGGAVKGNHIDVCVSSHQEALELGVRRAEVWWEEKQERRACFKEMDTR